MKFFYSTIAALLFIPQILSAQIVTHTSGKIEIPGVSSSDGPLGLGSLLWFSSSGSVFTSIQENWGLNLSGSGTRPIRVSNTSLLVGYYPDGNDYASGNAYVAQKVGIGTLAPVSLLQVDDGCTKANLGDASGTGLNYGTSYLGFNAARSGTSWSTSNDGESGGAGKNGGGVIYSSIWGDMYFSILPTTGGTSGQTLTDDQVRGNIAMRIDHTNGALYAKQAYVQITGWPDYVFNKNYNLMPLMQLKSYIDQNHHLPDMPAAAEVEKNGQDLGEINKLLTKKVEELTLYLIEKDQKEKVQDEIITKQGERIKSIEQALEVLLKQNKN